MLDCYASDRTRVFVRPIGPKVIKSISNDSELYLEMNLQPCDNQLLTNAAREAFKNDPDACISSGRG
jgi:hypothetical protein